MHQALPLPTDPASAGLALIGSRAVRRLMNNCSQMHLWRLTNEVSYQVLGFPKPIKINGRNYFRVSAVREWIAEREAMSQNRLGARPHSTAMTVNGSKRIGGRHDR